MEEPQAARPIRIYVIHQQAHITQVEAYFAHKRKFNIVGAQEQVSNAIEDLIALTPDLVLLDPFLPDLGNAESFIRELSAGGIGVVVAPFGKILPQVQLKLVDAGAIWVITEENPSVVDVENAINTAYELQQASKVPESETTALLTEERTLMGEEDFSEDAAVLLSPEHVEKQGKVICFYSPKGGVGATAIAVASAFALAEMTKEDVALVDMNLQLGELDLILGLDGTGAKDISAALPQQGASSASASVDPILLERAMIRKQNVHVLLAPILPEQTSRIKVGHLRQILHILRDQYTYVCVNIGTALTDYSIGVMEEVDEVVTVMIPEFTSLKDTLLFLTYAANSLEFSQDKVRLLLNRADPKTEKELSLDDPKILKGRRFFAKLPEHENYPPLLFTKDATVDKDSDKLHQEFRDLARSLMTTSSVERLEAAGLSGKRTKRA